MCSPWTILDSVSNKDRFGFYLSTRPGHQWGIKSGFKNLSQKSQSGKNLLGPHFYYLLLVYLHVCARVHLPWCTVLCGSQRTTFRNQFSPTLRVLEIRLGPLDLAASAVVNSGHLSGPENSFSNLPNPHLPPRHFGFSE